MAEQMAFPLNSKFSDRYAAWEEKRGICRAPLCWEGNLLGPVSQLNVSGQILAVGKEGTVVIRQHNKLLVWDSEGVTEYPLPYQPNQEFLVSVTPPFPYREDFFDHLIEGLKEWVVLDKFMVWRVEEEAVIAYAPNSGDTVVYLSPDRYFFTRIPHIARARKTWIGATHHLVGIAFPEVHMVISLAELPAMITNLSCNDIGVAVISGHCAYYSLWEQKPNGMLALPRWVKCGVAHRVMWNDNNLLVVLYDINQVHLSRFVVKEDKW